MMRLCATSAVILVLLASTVDGIQVDIVGLRPRLWGGDTVRLVVRVSGVQEGEPIRVAYGLVFREQVVQGEAAGLAGPGERQMALTLPQVTARVGMTLDVRAFRDKTLLAERSCPVEVFPRGALPALAAAYSSETVGVAGSGPFAGMFLERVPFQCKQLHSPAEVRRFDGKVAFLAADGPLSERSELASALMERVAQGLNLVCLDPGGWPLTRGWTAQGARPAEVKEARVLAPDHPILAGLKAADLANWGSDGVVARNLLPLPGAGNCLTILDAPLENPPGAVAIELRYGTGRILCCALEAAQKLPEEPVAQLVLANLIRWGFGQGPALRDPYGCFRASSDVPHGMAELGVRFAHAEQDAKGMVLADDSIFEAKNAALCTRLLAGGGTLVVFGLSEERLEPLNGLLRERWEADVRGQPPRLALEQTDMAARQTAIDEPRHPLLAGVRPEDVQALAVGLEAPVWAVSAVADEMHWRSLIGAGLIGKLERDGVRIVFWQIPVKDEGAEARKRALSSVLTNLGVRLQPPG